MSLAPRGRTLLLLALATCLVTGPVERLSWRATAIVHPQTKTPPSAAPTVPPPPKTIFFLDSAGRLPPFFLTRCVLEAWARRNPNHTVVLYSNSFEPEHAFRDGAPRVQVRPWDPMSWTAGVPELLAIREWFASPRARTGFVFNNLADAARLVLLYRHGGTYVDLDVLALRPLSDFEGLTSVVGWESTLEDLSLTREETTLVNNAVMINFPPRSPYVLECIRRSVDEFRADDWSWQGPKLLTRVLTAIRGGPRATASNAMGGAVRAVDVYGDDSRFAVHVVPKWVLYPVGWHEVGKLFDSTSMQVSAAMLGVLQRQTPFTVHLYASLVQKQLGLPHLVGGAQQDSILMDLYRHACPVTHASEVSVVQQRRLQTRPGGSGDKVPLVPVVVTRRSNYHDESLRMQNMRWGEHANLAEWIVAKARLHFEHPKVGVQMNARKQVEQMLVSVQLELPLEDAALETQVKQALEHELLLCVGIDRDMRRCTAGNVHAFALGHVPSTGQHILHAWLQDLEGEQASPLGMIASVAFTFDIARARKTTMRQSPTQPPVLEL